MFNQRHKSQNQQREHQPKRSKEARQLRPEDSGSSHDKKQEILGV